MSAEDTAALARAWAQAAWVQHDLEAAAQYLAPDWVGHYAGIGDAHGVDGFKRIAGVYLRAFPDLTITVDDAFGDGEKLVRRVRYAGTHQGVFLGVVPTGRQIQVEASVILRMAGGKIVEEWAIENLLGLFQQLGAVPTFFRMRPFSRCRSTHTGANLSRGDQSLTQVQEESITGESAVVPALLHMAAGYPLARCLHAVADLGVADALDGSPRTAAGLAEAVGVQPDPLERVLRLLSAHGVFAVRDGGFGHTPASRLLRTDDPGSIRAVVRLFGLPPVWASQGALMHSLRTGQLAAEEIQPGGFWGYLAGHPDARSVFNAAMSAKAQGQVAGVLAAYDFSGFSTIADIGGGRGHLLRAILEAVPTARGVLFDLAPVIQEVSDLASARLELQAGDFFTDPLPVCDAYLLMEVIHDWDDTQAVRILQAVRRAAPSEARLLVIEQMMPDDPGPHWAKTLDLHMLALLGGRQRSRQQYAALLERAGFAFQRQIDSRADIAILEASPT